MGKHKKAGRLPKRIGGVKLPKELRRSGERLIAEVDTPANRELLASGLAAVAAAVAQSSVKNAAARAADHGPEQPGARGTRGPDPVGSAVGMAATALLAGWLARKAQAGGGSSGGGSGGGGGTAC